MKKNIFTVEKTDLAKMGKKWRHHGKNSIFEPQILFYNFFENFSSIWSFLGHLLKKLEKNRNLLIFPKFWSRTH